MASKAHADPRATIAQNMSAPRSNELQTKCKAAFEKALAPALQLLKTQSFPIESEGLIDIAAPQSKGVGALILRAKLDVPASAFEAACTDAILALKELGFEGVPLTCDHKAFLPDICEAKSIKEKKALDAAAVDLGVENIPAIKGPRRTL